MKWRRGIATTIENLAEARDAINFMSPREIDAIRLAWGNPAIQGTSRRYLPNGPAIMREFLDEGFNIIVDRNHMYPIGPINDNQITLAIEGCKEVIDIVEPYGNQAIVELLNERNNETANLTTKVQRMDDELRDYGYTGWLNYNLLPGHGPQNPLSIDDRIRKYCEGNHLYFNSSTVNYAMSYARKFSDRGIWAHLTEIGANWNEYRDFTVINVDKTENFIQRCQDEGVRPDGNNKIVPYLWMNNRLDNWLGRVG